MKLAEKVGDTTNNNNDSVLRIPQSSPSDCFCVICKTLVERILSVCKNAASVFWSHSLQGQSLEMDKAITVLKDTICISQIGNNLQKVIQLTILPQSMCKLFGSLVFLTFYGNQFMKRKV